MTVRTDVTIEWGTSPRIITVLAPSTNITIQDIVDTCRTLEGEQIDLTYDHIIDAAGKQNLGGGVLVGVTCTLNNALLAFEARSGPSYTQCTVNGGNLVAIDSLGVYQTTPIEPTSFTQVILTSSSSATLQQSDDIEYASFNGGVTIDLTTSYSGTAFPVGTPRQPVNNFSDALTIANSRGLDTFYLPHAAITLDSLNYQGIDFSGAGEQVTLLTIPVGADVTNCNFDECNISGTLRAGAYLEECGVGTLNYVNGLIQHSILYGDTQLGGDTNFSDVVQGNAATVPIIDFNGTNSALVMRSYSGAVVLKNKTSSTGDVSIDLISGVVTIDSTCTAGNFTIRGAGQVINNSVGTAVDTSGLTSRKQDIINAKIVFG